MSTADPSYLRIIVTIPIDLSYKSTRDLAELEEKGVRGLYVCVEHIQEMAGDVIEWRRVACLDPGGFVPKFIAQKSTLNRLIEVRNPLVWPVVLDNDILPGKYQVLELAEELDGGRRRTISE